MSALTFSEVSKRHLADLRTQREARVRRILLQTTHQTQQGLSMPKIHMIISPWFADEHGIMTRTIRSA